jgi:hypothetical protein
VAEGEGFGHGITPIVKIEFERRVKPLKLNELINKDR